MLPLTPVNYGAPGETAPTLLQRTVPPSQVTNSASPTLRQTGFGVVATDGLNQTQHYTADHLRAQIYHPSQAPSGQSTENMLLAKALMSQPFVHSGAATKMARVSNMYLDSPRFGSAVNLLS